ncbi:unnamed protein product [Parnassius apollo]|uniref:(apollo) hypothetical protein n=1 Tax=Parnassius apollo TaxID=110799 RepID=A0A8S3VZS8_PARAO|nr:unnamed protein product [Parnassius apollo]
MRTAQKFIIDDLDSETMLNIKNLRKIIKEEITAALKSAIQVQVSEQLEIIKQQITTFHESMTFFNEKFEEMKRNLAEKSIIIKNLEVDNEKLKASVHSIRNNLNIMEQFARSSNIEIQCLPENREENILNTVVQIGKVINCNVNETDISHCIRISKQNPQSTRPRSVPVRFNNQRIRDSFIASASKYQPTRNCI